MLLFRIGHLKEFVNESKAVLSSDKDDKSSAREIRTILGGPTALHHWVDLVENMSSLKGE